MPATLPRPPFAAFPEWRPGQLETVEAVIQSRRRFQLVTAPTGSGKSLIAAAIAGPEPAAGVILTATKQLQDQYQADFPGFAELRGISNYPCAAADGLQVNGPHVVVSRLDRMAAGEVPNHAGAAPCHDAPWKPYRQEEIQHLPGGGSQRVKGAWVDPCPLAHDGCAYIAARKAVTAHDRPAILNYHVWAASAQPRHDPLAHADPEGAGL